MGGIEFAFHHPRLAMGATVFRGRDLVDEPICLGKVERVRVTNHVRYDFNAEAGRIEQLCSPMNAQTRQVVLR